MKKLIPLISLFMLACFSVLGCKEKEPEITGNWIFESDTQQIIELYSDNTGIMYGVDESGNGLSYAISWIAENNRIKFSLESGIGAVSYNYTLKDNNLILSDDTGEWIYYKE